MQSDPAIMPGVMQPVFFDSRSQARVNAEGKTKREGFIDASHN